MTVTHGRPMTAEITDILNDHPNMRLLNSGTAKLDGAVYVENLLLPPGTPAAPILK